MTRDSIPLRDVLHLSKDHVPVLDHAAYSCAGLRAYPAGFSSKGQRKGSDFRSKQLQTVRAGQFGISRTRIQQRHWGIVPPELNGAVVHHSTACFDIDPKLNARYFAAYLSTALFQKAAAAALTKQGRLDLRRFVRTAIPFPSAADQARIAEVWQQADKALKHTLDMAHSISELKQGVAADLFRRAASSSQQQRLEACAEIGHETRLTYALYLSAQGKVLQKQSAFSLADDGIGITPKTELDAQFLQYYLEQQQPHWQTAMMPLQLETSLRKLTIPLPALYEQRKIAAVLQEHDDVLHKLKVEHHELRHLTEGLMQQIFNGNLPAQEAIALLGTL